MGMENVANRVSEVYCQSPNGLIIPSNCHCPITNTPCDGGGNRHQTALDPNNLPTHIKEFAHVLSSNFPDVVGKIQCAICSIIGSVIFLLSLLLIIRITLY